MKRQHCWESATTFFSFLNEVYDRIRAQMIWTHLVRAGITDDFLIALLATQTVVKWTPRVPVFIKQLIQTGYGFRFSNVI